MSETPIERVARAIYEKRNGRGCKPWGNQPTAHKEPYLSDARAAMEAMRPATEAMHRAAWNACDRGNHALEPNGGWAEYNGRVFGAMIDAALSYTVIK